MNKRPISAEITRAARAYAPTLAVTPAEAGTPPDGAPPEAPSDTTLPASDTTLPGSDATLPTSSSGLDELAAKLPVVARDAYALDAEVAQGGIGRVWSARDERLGRPVAIKELLIRDREQEKRFVREALVTARLQHPAIVPIYEAGRWPDGEPFYAMKLVSGRTLSDVIDESPTLAGRLALLPHVLTVAQAVAYAHGQHVLHRDLKPANVLVGELGETVVIDWGVAKDLSQRDSPVPGGDAPARSDVTVVGTVVGTPAYMPPEQAAGHVVDERADIYAIGAMLYHVIAAVPPYHDVPWRELFSTIASKPPRPVEAHAPTIADELSAIVHKAMARDPADRYPTAKALADDLTRFQTGQIVGAHRYSTAQLARRFWRRHRAALSSAAVAFMLMAVVIIGALVKTDAERRLALVHKAEAESAGQAAAERADELTLLQAESAVQRDPNEAIAWLKTLSPSFTDAAELRRVAAEAASHGISRVFRGHTAYINDLALLDGGRRFVTSSDDRTLRIWDVADGRSRVLEGHTDEVWRVAVFPAGDRLVSASKDRTARIWQVSTGALLATAALPAIADRVVVRADGAVVGNSFVGKGPPWLWPPGAAAVRLLGDPADVLDSSTVSADGRKVVLELKGGTAFVLDTESGDRRALGVMSTGHAMWTVSDDGRTAVRTRTSRGTPPEHELWDLEARTRRPLATPGVWARTAFSRRGDLVAVATEARVDVVETGTGALVRSFPGSGSSPRVLAFSADGRALALGNYDRRVWTWDLATGESKVYAGLHGIVSRVEFLPDNRALLGASGEGEVRLFTPTGEGAVLSDAHARATGLAVSAEGRVASLDEEGHLRIVELSGAEVADHALGAGANPILRASPDGRRFAGASLACVDYDRCPRADEARRGALVLGSFGGARPMLAPAPAAVRALAWRAAPAAGRPGAPAGEDEVIVALHDGTVQRVTLDGVMTEIERLPAPAAALAVSADGSLVATGGDDGLVRVVDLASGASRDLGRHDDRVRVLAFAPRGRVLASGSGDHTARVWQLADGSYRALVTSSGVLDMAFSADGEVLMGAIDNDVLLRRWSVASGGALPSFAGHEGAIVSISLSPDGRRVLTGSLDRSARLFDMASGKSRALTGHKGAVVATAFAPGGKVLVTLGDEGAVRAWPDDLPEGMAELRAFLEAATPDRVHVR